MDQRSPGNHKLVMPPLGEQSTLKIITPREAHAQNGSTREGKSLDSSNLENYTLCHV